MVRVNPAMAAEKMLCLLGIKLIESQHICTLDHLNIIGINASRRHPPTTAIRTITAPSHRKISIRRDSDFHRPTMTPSDHAFIRFHGAYHAFFTPSWQ
jgi:hypothetical protein